MLILVSMLLIFCLILQSLVSCVSAVLPPDACSFLSLIHNLFLMHFATSVLSCLTCFSMFLWYNEERVEGFSKNVALAVHYEYTNLSKSEGLIAHGGCSFTTVYVAINAIFQLKYNLYFYNKCLHKTKYVKWSAVKNERLQTLTSCCTWLTEKKNVTNKRAVSWNNGKGDVTRSVAKDTGCS